METIVKICFDYQYNTLSTDPPRSQFKRDFHENRAQKNGYIPRKTNAFRVPFRYIRFQTGDYTAGFPTIIYHNLQYPKIKIHTSREYLQDFMQYLQ